MLSIRLVHAKSICLELHENIFSVQRKTKNILARMHEHAYSIHFPTAQDYVGRGNEMLIIS